MPARALMFMGTGSDVGKSLLVAGLCRLFTDRGLRVAPFKPQNMSNNAAVTPDGGEIGRAQALQARACRLAPSVHMNPVLLKPQSETGAQIIVHGRMAGSAAAREFQDRKASLLPAVLDSFGRLRAQNDLVLVEGAGSASEINLRSNDIANMGFAQAGNVPVVLIGDIDRGGVIASIVGTKAVLAVADAAMIEGFIVNKMRGDASLFADGMEKIAALTGWRPIGLVPYFPPAAKLPAEDALALDHVRRTGGGVKICVLAYPRISNFDEFDALRLEPDVELAFLRDGEPIPADAKLAILPGSKSTISDLAALRRCGWDVDLAAFIRRGGEVLGVCGGYQMLGQEIDDPEGIEGTPTKVQGLGHLDISTTMLGDKRLIDVSGRWIDPDIAFRGYEMHVGRSSGSGAGRPLVEVEGRPDGAVSAGGRVAGCYIHGLFANDALRRHWLERLGGRASELVYEAHVEEALDELARHLAAHVDADALLRIAR